MLLKNGEGWPQVKNSLSRQEQRPNPALLVSASERIASAALTSWMLWSDGEPVYYLIEASELKRILDEERKNARPKVERGQWHINVDFAKDRLVPWAPAGYGVT